MAFCLPTQFTTKFLEALKNGKIVPEKLIEMSSEERRNFFKDIVGEKDAQEVNARLESKLILKDQKRGMVSWAKQVSGINESVRRDIISKIENMKEILTPQNEQSFLHDLVAKKLGTEVTLEETKKITDLAKKIQELPANGREQGLAKLDLQDYVQSLMPFSRHLATNIANIPKTILSTLDFSALFRQGWGMISRGEFYKAIPEMFKYAFSKEAYRNLQADIISDPLYETMKKSGLRISILADRLSQREEAYTTTLLGKIPGVAGSERAFVGFLNKLRIDVFKHLIKNAELAGENVKTGSQITKDIANVVNDFTGSGNIGKGDRYSTVVPALNATFFSPRKISATINMFNPARYLDPRISQTARLAALRQLIGSVAITTTVLALAKASGQKVETDSRSADFGKIVSGKTRFEVTGGNSTYAVLISRIIHNQIKSSTSGKIIELGRGYKPTTRADIIIGKRSFARNKLSPVASLFADWLYGEDTQGKAFNVKSELIKQVTPLIIDDMINLMKQDKSHVIQGTLGDMFGLGIQVY